MSNLNHLLDQKFSEDLTDPLVSIVQRAYRANADCHDPFLGHDEMSFGLLNYKTIKRFVCDLAEKNDWIRIAKHAPQFIFSMIGFRMSHYRVGDAFDLDPADSFPRNRNGAWMFASHNKRQQLLFDMYGDGAEWNENNLPSVILAHCGDFERGLSQVFLGVPADFDERNQITRWESVKILWQRGDASAVIPTSDSSDGDNPSVPTEDIAPPKLTIVPTKKAAGEK
jgi:hypothetical protein